MPITPPTDFRCIFTKDLTLAAGVAQDVDVPIDGAESWSVVVKNTGSTNDVTALTLAHSPLGVLFSPAVAAPSGIPLAAGVTLLIEGEHEPMKYLRLTLTSTSGTTVSIEAGGR